MNAVTLLSFIAVVSTVVNFVLAIATGHLAMGYRIALILVVSTLTPTAWLLILDQERPLLFVSVPINVILFVSLLAAPSRKLDWRRYKSRLRSALAIIATGSMGSLFVFSAIGVFGNYPVNHHLLVAWFCAVMYSLLAALLSIVLSEPACAADASPRARDSGCSS